MVAALGDNVNTKTKGSYGELFIMAQAVNRGYTVCVPYGDNQRYDLLFERNGTYNRVQVKYLLPTDGKIKFSMWTVTHNKDVGDTRAYKRVRYTSEEVDTYAVMNADTHVVYMIPVRDVEHQSTITLRTDRTMQYRKCALARWADEYTW